MTEADDSGSNAFPGSNPQPGSNPRPDANAGANGPWSGPLRPGDRRQGAPDRRQQPPPGPWQPGSEHWPGAGFNAGPYGTRPGNPGYGEYPGWRLGASAPDPAGPGGAAPRGFGPGGPAPGGFGPGGAYGPRPGGYGWYGGYARPIGPPWIAGTVADKVLAFAAGFFFNFVGLFGAIVLIYLWANNNNGPEDAAERRAHAQSVSIWSGVGCALQVGLFMLMFVAIFTFATHAVPAGAIP